MSCTIAKWTASAHGDGERRVIEVTGDGECSFAGCDLKLVPTNEGVVDDPKVAALRLIVETPPGAAQVITPAHVEAEIKGDPATEIRIDTPSGTEWVSVREA